MSKPLPPYFRSISHFLLSLLLFICGWSSGLVCDSNLWWCFCILYWIASWTVAICRSWCIIWLDIYQGASTIVHKILDYALYKIAILDLLAYPRNNGGIEIISALYIKLFSFGILDFLSSIQYKFFIFSSICLHFLIYIIFPNDFGI